jgi:integrase
MNLHQARAAAETVAVALSPGQAKVSLRQFAETFMRDCAGRWKAATIEGHRHSLNKLILPALGDLAVDEISYADVTAWLDGLDVAGRSKDRATSVLSSLIRHAETLGLRPAGSNPCAGRRPHRSDFEARYLTARDYRRLALALDHAAKADPVEAACIRFLMLTGARRGEALSLEWSMVQSDRATLPDSKTGPKCLWFATPVRQILAGLDRVKGTPYVFVRPCGRGIHSSLDRVWRAVRRQGGLAGLRLHDLRHSYASVAVSNGEELRTVAALLGHSQMVTTLGYAHLADRPVMAAARRIDDHLAAALTPLEAVEPIRPKSWECKQRRSRKQRSSRAVREAQAVSAARHGRFEPKLKTETKAAPEPKPARLKRQPVDEDARRWAPYIQAWRKSKLKFPAFCEQEMLDPTAMRKALARHLQRAKRAHGEQRS